MVFVYGNNTISFSESYVNKRIINLNIVPNKLIFDISDPLFQRDDFVETDRIKAWKKLITGTKEMLQKEIPYPGFPDILPNHDAPTYLSDFDTTALVVLPRYDLDLPVFQIVR